MKIANVNKISYKSRACPVKPYTIKTKYGKLFVAEAGLKEIKRKSFINNLSYFFCNNFASMTKDPNWLPFKQKMSAMKDNFNFQNFSDYIKTRLNSKDNSLTLLLAKDKHKRIQGACLAYKYDDITDVDSVYYINSIAVNRVYRHFGVASSLLQETIKSVSSICSDAFLTGDRMAEGFYRKIGFEPLNPNDDNQNTIIKYISKQRFDYPDYVDLFNKPLKHETARWYIKAAEIINKT